MPSGIEWVTRRNRIENGPTRGRPLARRDHVELAAIGHPVLLQLALEQRQRERRPVDRDVRQLAEQVRQRADVILVAVREHDGLDPIGAVPDVVEVRQDQVDPRTCPPTGTTGPRRPTGCGRPARCRPCSGPPRRRHRGRRRERRCQRRPASSSALRTRVRSSAVAGTSGSRGTPAGRPMHPQRRLQRDRVARDEQGVEERRQVLVDLAGGGDVAGLDQLDHLADLRAHQVARDGDDPDRAQAHVAERRPVVARSRPRSRAAPRPSAATPPGSHRWSPSPRRCWDAWRAPAACRARSASRSGRGCCRR